MDFSRFDREGNDLRAIGGAQPTLALSDVKADGAFADAEAGSDNLVAASSRDQCQDFALPFGQPPWS
jgi:hypothetical protein